MLPEGQFQWQASRVPPSQRRDGAPTQASRRAENGLHHATFINRKTPLFRHTSPCAPKASLRLQKRLLVASRNVRLGSTKPRTVQDMLGHPAGRRQGRRGLDERADTLSITFEMDLREIPDHVSCFGPTSGIGA